MSIFFHLQLLLGRYGINADEFWKLKDIGGHSTYHLEGNALKHTIMVYEEACKMYPDNEVMQKAALLHDIGKIYTSIEVAPGDWVYPDHSTCGSFKGILCKFIDLKDPHFVDYQWLIRNHIRPLYWNKKGIATDNEVYGELDKSICTLNNLRNLAICDLKGSKAKDPKASEELIAYLNNLIL